jgi:integrase
LLRAVEGLNCIPIFKLAMRFLAITAARPAMVLGAKWDEIEATGANIPTWRVPRERMKMRDEYVSPLPGAALDVLQAVKRFRVGRFVFPGWHQSSQQRPLAANCFNRVLDCAGWHDHHSAHGFRASFSTIMNDRPGTQPGDEDAIEAQLARKLPGVKGIYNHGTYFERRSEIVSDWSSLILDGAPDAISLAGYSAPAVAA